MLNIILEKLLKFIKEQIMNFPRSVALNVAAGLIVSGKENNFRIAFEKASSI